MSVSRSPSSETVDKRSAANTLALAPGRSQFTTGCDLARWRRRRHWEYWDLGNAPCIFQFGFDLKGTLTAFYWIESDQIQSDPEWEFLNGGRLLSASTSLPEPPATGFYIDGPIQLNENWVSMTYEGGNDNDLVAPELSLKIELRLAAGLTEFPFQVIFESQQFHYGPSKLRAWQFDTFVQSLPPSPQFPEPLGTFTVTPLDVCAPCRADDQ